MRSSPRRAIGPRPAGTGRCKKQPTQLCCPDKARDIWSGQKNNEGEAGMISRFIAIGLFAAGLSSTMPSGSANAQAIARQITLVVPYSAGGGTDTVARLIGNQMSRTLGQAIIIENVVGAGGTRANERVARSEPNGTTVLINHVALLAAPSLFTNLRYETEKDFEPVGLVNNAPMLLVGRKSIPGQGPKDFVEWIRSRGANAN